MAAPALSSGRIARLRSLCSSPPRLGAVRACPRNPRPPCGAGASGAAYPGGSSNNSSSSSLPRPLRAQAVARPFGSVSSADPSDLGVEDVQVVSVKDLMQGYYKLFRGWNAIPSLMLVLLGAWTGTGKTVLALKHLTVWFMGAASASVALASCAINDYFDWRLDAVNDASKPIPSGLIAPDRALLVAALVYICLLALACVVPNTGVRLIVAASAAATVLYTPLIKRHLLAKNLVVASVIAAAPLAGALAAGAAGPGLRAVAAPSAFLWLLILQREIMMDIQDRGGDGAAGVRTLPVVLGPRAACGLCLALLAACVGLAAHAALNCSGLAWIWAAHPGLEGPLRAAALAAVCATLARPVRAAFAVLRSGFAREQVSVAIDSSMVAAGLGTLLLALII